MERNIFVFLADAWGAAGGGINCFNYDLVKACGAAVKTNKGLTICCAVPGLSDEGCKEMEEVQVVPMALPGLKFPEGSVGVEMIKGYIKAHPRLNKLFLGHCNVFWVGHDIYTGELAGQCADSFPGWSVVFHHMDYEAYYNLKNPNAEVGVAKKRAQRKVLRGSDLIFAVGPKLVKSAQDLILGTKEEKVLELYPGLAEVEPIEKTPNKFRTVVLGRVEHDNQVVKQIGLAKDAFAEVLRKDKGLNRFGDDPVLSIVGYSDDSSEALAQETKRLQDEVCKIAGRMVNISARPYLSDREELLGEISETSVSMMLSLHEGFGLVGYEAIAAGVPVIITENSGLYQFLEREKLSGMVCSVRINGSSDDCGYSQEDLEAVSTALWKIRSEEGKYKQRALELQRELKGKPEVYSWAAVAQGFLDKTLGMSERERLDNSKIFYRPDDILPPPLEGVGAIDVEGLKAARGSRVFYVRGKSALKGLNALLKMNCSDEDYKKVRIYYTYKSFGEDEDSYEDFITDCMAYFHTDASKEYLQINTALS